MRGWRDREIEVGKSGMGIENRYLQRQWLKQVAQKDRKVGQKVIQQLLKKQKQTLATEVGEYMMRQRICIRQKKDTSLKRGWRIEDGGIEDRKGGKKENTSTKRGWYG